ncbi:MAG: transporter substrate-binding domain-containing protein [Andreesenia angusta]|nr:transporter substrate-binding domain-containing protein [Andreesenia angusta]
MKRLKKIIPAILLSGVMALSLVGCGDSKDESAKDLEKIKEKGEVVLGTSADYPPFEFMDKEGNFLGMDIEIAKELAKDMGVELKIQDMQFESLITALNANKVDMILSGMNPTEERRENVDFSDIYYESKHFMIVREADLDKIKKEEDLKGKKIGVQLGTTQEKLAKEKFKDSEFEVLPAIPDLIMLLENNKVDAVVTEDAVAENYANVNDKLSLNGLSYEDSESGVSVAVRKNNPELVEQLNKTIKRLNDEGKIKEFYNEAVEISSAKSK